MSGASSLTPLQWRLIRVLAPLQPAWTLTGGAALGIRLGHRETRDLDLFFRERRQLGELPREAETLLAAAGLATERLQTAPAFQRLRVTDADQTCLVDLVADPVPPVTDPELVSAGQATFRVDTLHELLVNKLCAFLSRSELRDLVDVRALLAEGGDLERAARDAPRKDAGFSPLVLAWLLRDWRPVDLARSTGWSEEESAALQRFHAELLGRIAALAAPE